MSQPTIRQGDEYSGSRSLVITVTDSAGVAVDLTGTDLRFMVKRYATDPDADALISKSTGSGITLAAQTGATLGQALIAISSAESDIVPGTLYFEVEATDSIGILTLVSGRIVVQSDLIQGA